VQLEGEARRGEEAGRRLDETADIGRGYRLRLGLEGDGDRDERGSMQNEDCAEDSKQRTASRE
jgi:hypothetical protein